MVVLTFAPALSRLCNEVFQFRESERVLRQTSDSLFQRAASAVFAKPLVIPMRDEKSSVTKLEDEISDSR